MSSAYVVVVRGRKHHTFIKWDFGRGFMGDGVISFKCSF